MHELKAATKLKSWPTPQDFNEAIQNLRVNCSDPELQCGEAEVDLLGLPRPRTGAFASVYRVIASDKQYALRCFLTDIPDSQPRYELISKFIQSDTLPYTVNFDFQQSGLKVKGEWLPCLKMEWVNGETLDNYLRANYKKLDKELPQKFLRMMHDLESAGIAHGDLQHGNIMIDYGKLYLVDYDNMFVPGMEGWASNEIGHRNYQHPLRNATTFGPCLDNFSAWVVYISLLAIADDHKLFDKLQAGDNCLLFRQSDFLSPIDSPAFATLERHPNKELNRLTRQLRSFLSSAPDDVPSISAASTLPIPALEDIPAGTAEERKDPGIPLVLPSYVNSWQPSWTIPSAAAPSSALQPYAGLQQELPRKIKFFSYSKTHQFYTGNWARQFGPKGRVLIFSGSAEVMQGKVLLLFIGLMILSILWQAYPPFCAIACFLAVLGLAAVSRPLCSPAHLARYGAYTIGTITEKNSAAYREDGYAVDELTYEFPFEGSAQLGRQSVSPDMFKGATVGDKITVLYDRNSQKSMIYEASDVQCVPDVPVLYRPISGNCDLTKIEPELNQQLPRKVTSKLLDRVINAHQFQACLLIVMASFFGMHLGVQLGSGNLVLFMAIGLLASVCLLPVSIGKLDQRRLVRMGKATRAVIKSKNAWSDRAAVFEFFNELTRSFEKSKVVLTDEQLSSLRIGEEVTILYDQFTTSSVNRVRPALIYKFAKFKAVDTRAAIAKA